MQISMPHHIFYPHSISLTNIDLVSFTSYECEVEQQKQMTIDLLRSATLEIYRPPNLAESNRNDYAETKEKAGRKI